MKNNKLLIPIAAVVLIVIGAAFLLFPKSQKPIQEVVEEEKQQEVKTLKEEDIGLFLKLRSDKKGLIMRITKIEGILSVEYQGTYDAEVVDGGEKLTVTRGFGPSTIEIKASDKEILRDDLLFGTCSKNVCKYDKVVSDIKFIMKVNFKNGEIGNFEQSISL